MGRYHARAENSCLAIKKSRARSIQCDNPVIHRKQARGKLIRYGYKLGERELEAACRSGTSR